MSKRHHQTPSARRGKVIGVGRITSSAHRRIRRISFRENWNIDMTLVVIVFLLAAFWIIPWLSGL
jgi:hypothetical protein